MSFNKLEINQPIRLAFLGCGFATKLHSKTLRKFKNVQRFYASRSEEKARKSMEQYRGSGYFSSYEQAINAPEIDVVLIATPPDRHLELTVQAIRAGKHVIVEKPPFFKSTDFDLVEAERKKTNVQVMIAENYFYKPNLQRLRQLIPSGVIGEIKFLYLNATKTQKTEGWRDDLHKAGGGALFEGGIHWVNFLANLGLSVQSVQGFQPGKNQQELERSMQVVATYKEGAIGTLLYSWEINTLLFGLRLSRIYGTKGSISFESNGIFIFVRGKKWRLIFPGFSDIAGYQGMFKDFFQALHTGSEPSFTLAMAQQDLQLIEKAYEGSKTSKSQTSH